MRERSENLGANWAQLRRDLMRFTERFGLRRADAEDIVHQVFQRVIVRKGSLDAEARPGYVKKMCLNAVRNEQRSRSRRQRQETAWVVHVDQLERCETPELVVMKREQATLLEGLLTTLGEELHLPIMRAMLLCDVQGLTVSRAAIELNAPEGTVKTWLRRGRKHLRRSGKRLLMP
jgi:RNA polymerase sigma factor (sigma-70 family)